MFFVIFSFPSFQKNLVFFFRGAAAEPKTLPPQLWQPPLQQPPAAATAAVAPATTAAAAATAAAATAALQYFVRPQYSLQWQQ